MGSCRSLRKSISTTTIVLRNMQRIRDGTSPGAASPSAKASDGTPRSSDVTITSFSLQPVACMECKRIIKRRAVTSFYDWEYLTTAWYDTYFEPFAQTIPLNPFFIAGNPSKITTDVGFVWTDRDVEPVNMGVNAYRSVSLSVTGYY